MTIGTVTTTTVQISWAPPANYDSNGVIRYDIEVIEYQFELGAVKVNTTGSSVTVTGLEENNVYSCRVAAVSSSRVGTFSLPTNFTTLESGSCKLHSYHTILEFVHTLYLQIHIAQPPKRCTAKYFSCCSLKYDY